MDIPPQHLSGLLEDRPEHVSSRKTKTLPLSILYSEKFQILDGNVWRKQAPNPFTNFKQTPASVELLTAEEARKFDVNGGLADNSIVSVGFPIPKEIIAVVRPKHLAYAKAGQGAQKSIVPHGLEMNMEVKLFDFVSPEAEVSKGEGGPRVVYSGNANASTKRSVKGLYCFSTEGNQLQHLFTQMGTYMFHFSLVGSKYEDVPPAVVRVNVAASNKDDQWSLCSPYGDLSKALTCRKPKRHKRIRFDSQTDELATFVPKKDITLVHVATLDSVVSVNSFFAIAVFLGLAFSPPLPAMQVVTSLAPPRVECYVSVDMYRSLILWEVVSFGWFLFSTLVAHGFKLFIVLGNGRNISNAKSVEVNHKFLRFGILASGLGMILGAFFMILSMISLIQVRLGNISCGNPWALRTMIPLVALSISGCAIFITALLYESTLE